MKLSSYLARALVGAALCLAFATGCSKKDAPAGGGGGGGGDDGKVASCNLPSMGSCREYRGGNLALGTDGLKELCSAVAPGEFKEVACPTEGVTGTCTKPEGKDFYYAAYPMPIADTEKSCTDTGGKFAK